MNHKEKTKKTVSFNEPKRSAQSISRAKNEWGVWYFEEKSEVFITHQADSNQLFLRIGRVLTTEYWLLLFEHNTSYKTLHYSKYVYWTLVAMAKKIPFA